MSPRALTSPAPEAFVIVPVPRVSLFAGRLLIDVSTDFFPPRWHSTLLGATLLLIIDPHASLLLTR